MYDLIAKALRSLSDDELGQLFRGTTNEALALAVHAGIAAAASPQEEEPRRPPRSTTKARHNTDDEEDVRRSRPTGKKKRKYKPRPGRLDVKPADETLGDVLTALREKPRLTRTAISARAGYAIWTVDRALRYLSKTGQIVMQLRGLEKLYEVAPPKPEHAPDGPAEAPTGE